MTLVIHNINNINNPFPSSLCHNAKLTHRRCGSAAAPRRPNNRAPVSAASTLHRSSQLSLPDHRPPPPAAAAVRRSSELRGSLAPRIPPRPPRRHHHPGANLHLHLRLPVPVAPPPGTLRRRLLRRVGDVPPRRRRDHGPRRQREVPEGIACQGNRRRVPGVFVGVRRRRRSPAAKRV